MARDPSGGVLPVRGMKIRDTTATRDLNHPLTGQTLPFAVMVLRADPPTV